MHTADETAYWSEDTLILSSGAGGKEPTSQCWRCKRCVFDPWVRKIPLEKEMATHSVILAWRIPWTEEPDGLQCTGLQRVGQD